MSEQRKKRDKLRAGEVKLIYDSKGGGRASGKEEERIRDRHWQEKIRSVMLTCGSFDLWPLQSDNTWPIIRLSWVKTPLLFLSPPPGRERGFEWGRTHGDSRFSWWGDVAPLAPSARLALWVASLLAASGLLTLIQVASWAFHIGFYVCCL